MHGRTRRRERQQLITDFPDSNRFHRLLLFDYASALNEPGRCFWYGTPVGVRRSVSVRVLLSVFVRAHAVELSATPASAERFTRWRSSESPSGTASESAALKTTQRYSATR